MLTDFPSTPLTFKEEAALANKGTEEAFQTMVMHSMRKAIAYAKHLSGDSLTLQELISVCYGALMRNAKRFDPKFKRSFFVFSKQGIQGDLKRYYKSNVVMRQGTIVHADPKRASDVSHTGDAGAKLWDDDDVVAPEHEISEPDFASINLRERWETVKEIMGKVLSDRERAILEFYYISGLNFQDIGDKVQPKITRSAVAIIHVNAMKKIRNVLLARKQLFNT